MEGRTQLPDKVEEERVRSCPDASISPPYTSPIAPIGFALFFFLPDMVDGDQIPRIPHIDTPLRPRSDSGRRGRRQAGEGDHPRSLGEV